MVVALLSRTQRSHRGHRGVHKGPIVAVRATSVSSTAAPISQRGFYDMDAPALIVAGTVIETVMTTPTLRPSQGGARDQAGDGREISLPRAVDRRRVRRVGERVQGRDGFFEAGAIAEKT